MKSNDFFRETDKNVSERIMSQQKEEWIETCQSCKGTGRMPNLPSNEILPCHNCFGKGEIQYES
jgi:DnaJ-class molecular chaperone